MSSNLIRANVFEPIPVNVYDIETKQIVFTGSQRKAAEFLCIPHRHISAYLKHKSRVRNKYAIRIAKINYDGTTKTSKD